MVGIQALQVQRVGMVDDETFGGRTSPVTHIELRTIPFLCHTTHQNRIFLSTQFMRQHLRKAVGNLHGLEMIVDKAIGCLRPFQDDIGALLTMECEESSIQFLTLGFENSHFHLDSCLTQFLDTTALYFGKLIDTAYNHPLHSFLDDQVGTRRCLTIM